MEEKVLKQWFGRMLFLYFVDVRGECSQCCGRQGQGESQLLNHFQGIAVA